MKLMIYGKTTFCIISSLTQITTRNECWFL